MKKRTKAVIIWERLLNYIMGFIKFALFLAGVLFGIYKVLDVYVQNGFPSYNFMDIIMKVLANAIITFFIIAISLFVVDFVLIAVGFIIIKSYKFYLSTQQIKNQ